MTKIEQIDFREILDSRGVPTVACDLYLSSGVTISASVPSGKSTGIHEAIELRDKNPKRYHGQGIIETAKKNLPIFNKALKGFDVFDQEGIDAKLIAIDGTPNKSKLGANFILSVSMAAAKASAKIKPIDTFPKIMVNILNGGAHASNNLDIQEFMIVPLKDQAIHEDIREVSEIFHTLLTILEEKNLPTAVGDEGGIAPSLSNHNEAIELILMAIERAGYKPGLDMALAFDFAASAFYENGLYHFENAKCTDFEFIEWIEHLTKKYPVISLEDPLDQDHFEHWNELMRRVGGDVQIVGDDLFVTNSKFLTKGIKEQSANAILIKPNQIGTITETKNTIKLAIDNDFGVVVSHRSGETTEDFIADFALSQKADFVKFGNICRGERVVKYNRLMELALMFEEI